jgi:hypothetical protein
MKGITRLAAKLAVFAAVGYGLYFASRYSDGRSVSKWTALYHLRSRRKRPIQHPFER